LEAYLEFVIATMSKPQY